MGKSAFLENEILDHILSAAAYTAPGTVHIALHTANPGEDGSGAEVTGGSYARVAVTNNATNWPAADAGSKSNGTVITFPTATGSWGTVTHFAIRDAATEGNLLYYGPLSESKAIGADDTAEFAVGAITITED